MTKTVVITGANRGIGLAFCQLYKQLDWKVIGLCRQASPELNAVADRVIEQIDVADAASVEKAREALLGESIDLLINNAGKLNNEVLGDIDYQSIEQQFAINAIGPLRMSEALLPIMAEGSKVAMITSRMGSIADNTSGGRYGYRMSKAALNMAATSLAKDLQGRGIAVGIYHPGLVATEMIGGHGDISAEQAAERLQARIEALSLATSGEFRHSNGETLPW